MVKAIALPVLLPSLLFSVGTGAVLPVLVLAALDLGATAGQASFLVALRGLVSLLLTVPAGQYIDRIGDRRAMVSATGAAVVVYAGIVATLAGGPAGGLILYALGLMALAPIENTWGLARQALVADTVAAADVGRALTLLGGTMRVGRLVGPLATAGLLVVWPVWSAFVAAAVCACLAVGVLFLPGARGFGTRRGGAAEASESAPRRRIRELEVRWLAVVLAGVSVAVLAILRALHPVLVPLVGVEAGLAESTIAVLIAVGAAVEIVLIIPGGHIKDRLGRVVTMVVCLGIFGAGFALLGLTGGFAGVVIAVVVMGVGNGLGSGVNMTIGADLSPARGRPTFLGVWAIFNNSGTFGGPLLASVTIAAAGLGVTAVAAAGLGWAGAVWMLAWSRTLGLPGGRPVTS